MRHSLDGILIYEYTQLLENLVIFYLLEIMISNF